MSNILSEVHPELVAEWSDKNLPLTPDRITYGSNKVVWWKGACGHEWQTSVKARSNGENCPICSGARVIEGINDLATLKPELADEWSSKNDPLKPTMVTTGSHKKVIWQDKYGHEWTATVKSRALNGTGCPYCSHNKILVGFNDLSQIGTMGGDPYWSWYGFNSRVEWCACFVSWCANECGYIDAGVIPKYAGCVNGVQWFKDRGQWLDNSAEPTPGMIIFFDWADESGQDGLSDHTGIVQKVENGRVYTVEGNSGDSVRQNSYPVGYYEILGYGAPAY